ncbi:MAG: cytochrome c3 family protein [Fidelibacterota bacterium]
MTTKNTIRMLLLFTGILIVGGIFVFGLIEVTSKPAFCSTCHFMEPYVAAWKTSSHADVTCTDCHFPPGFKSKVKGKLTAASMVVNYMTGVYKKSKPWAEIEDASCLRSGCHVERNLKGEIEFREGIIFDHEPHLTVLRRNKKLRCTSCHSQIVQGEHISVTKNTCFLCHFKQSELTESINSCTNCHNAPVKTEETPDVPYDHVYVLEQNITCQKCHGEMQVGDGSVPENRCSVCHAEIEKLEKYSDVEFIHKNHITDHKVECQSCHTSIQHKSIARTDDILPECNSCHESEHTEQLTLFTGRNTMHDYQLPNPMFEAGLNCQACHIFHESTSRSVIDKVSRAKGESCERCHGTGYAKLFDRWESIMEEKLTLVGDCLAKVREIIQTADYSDEILAKINPPLASAEYNYQLVLNGNVVHNVAFSDKLLVEASDDLQKITDLIGVEGCSPDLSEYSQLIPSECVNCHYGQEKVDVKAFGVTFSHDIHINNNKLPCSTCHSNRQNHGQTTITRSECLNCHHTQEKVSCEKCHRLQTEIYEGSIDLAVDIEADFMEQGDVDCLGCHAGEKDEPVIRPGAASCVDCHEEEYEDYFSEWQDEIQAEMEQLESILEEKRNGLSQEEIQSIRAALDSIRKDGSRGIHNGEAIRAILSQYVNLVQ